MLNIRHNEEHFPQADEAASTPPELLSSGTEDVPPTEDILALQEGGQDTMPTLCLEPLSFGEQLRNIRAEAGMTVADVAQKVRSSQEFILNLESGDFQKILQHDHYCRSFIERICLVYQVKPDELLDKFEQESRQAGRFSRLVDNSLQNVSGGGAVFAEEDLNEEKSVSPALHLPAILISLLVAVLFILLVSAWIMQAVRARKNTAVLQVIESNLPDLIKPTKVPLQVLSIPDN